MTDIILTTDEYERLKAALHAAQELVTAIPYITAAGGNVTRQNMTVVTLSRALEAASGIEPKQRPDLVEEIVARNAVPRFEQTDALARELKEMTDAGDALRRRTRRAAK